MPHASELLWSVVLITFIGVGALLLVFVARAFRRRLRVEKRTEAFTIQQLRELRDQGSITEPEYEAMRARVIGQVMDDSAESSSTKTPSVPGPEADGGDDRRGPTRGPAPEEER